jgi:hypothetical protein
MAMGLADIDFNSRIREIEDQQALARAVVSIMRTSGWRLALQQQMEQAISASTHALLACAREFELQSARQNTKIRGRAFDDAS